MLPLPHVEDNKAAVSGKDEQYWQKLMQGEDGLVSQNQIGKQNRIEDTKCQNREIETKRHRPGQELRHYYRYHTQIHNQGRVKVEKIAVRHLPGKNCRGHLQIDRLVGTDLKRMQIPVRHHMKEQKEKTQR